MDWLDGKDQNSLQTEDIRKSVEAYATRRNVEKCAHLASLEKNRGNDHTLNIPRYVDVFEED